MLTSEILKMEKCDFCSKKIKISQVMLTCPCNVKLHLACNSKHSKLCTFDYFEHNKGLLTKNNPVIMGEKLDKI